MGPLKIMVVSAGYVARMFAFHSWNVTISFYRCKCMAPPGFPFQTRSPPYLHHVLVVLAVHVDILNKLVLLSHNAICSSHSKTQEHAQCDFKYWACKFVTAELKHSNPLCVCVFVCMHTENIQYSNGWLNFWGYIFIMVLKMYFLHVILRPNAPFYIHFLYRWYLMSLKEKVKGGSFMCDQQQTVLSH